MASPVLPSRSSQVDRLVLAGFMGSGKTTVGRRVAKLLRWSFADLDEVISQREALSVPEIFQQRGEAYFRAAEVEALRNLLQTKHQVIALGGGAPETPALRELLLRDTGALVVHLQAPVEVLFARCLTQAAKRGVTGRPLLGTPDQAAARWARRLPLYQAVAAHALEVSDKDPHQLAEELAAMLAGDQLV